MTTAAPITPPFIFDEPTPTYTRTSDGLVCPSTTGIIRECRLYSLDHIREDFIVNRGRLGSYVHQCAHLDRLGELDIDRVHAAARPYVDAHRAFHRETGFKWASSENIRLGSVDGMPYGMTSDFTGADGDGREWVVDTKISRQYARWWGVQLAAYDMGLDPRPTSALRFQRRVVQLLENGRYKLHDFEDPSDYDVFRCNLYTVWWKRNNGIETE